MKVYIRKTGHIFKVLKKSKNFKILFWTRESKKTIFQIFPELFTKKGPETRESQVRRRFRESRVRRRCPGLQITGEIIGFLDSQLDDQASE